MQRFLPCLFLLLTACAPIPSDSGIEGRVTIGPMCPVMQLNVPCPDQPFQATLTVLTTASRHKVIQVRTDSDGSFRVALAPGTYLLRPESPNVMPHAAEQIVTVQPHQFTRIMVVYDSGIR